jgi:transcriptional regulator with XRE-family HTH domain
MPNIEERLCIERARMGFSQKELADIAGVTARTQRNYEAGFRKPDATYLSAVANYTDIDIQYVLTGERIMSELTASKGLLLVIAQRLGVEYPLVADLIKEAEAFENAHCGPGQDGGLDVARETYLSLVDKFFTLVPKGQFQLDQDLLANVMEHLERSSEQKNLSYKKKAQATITLYLSSVESGKVDIELVKSVINLGGHEGPEVGADEGR